MTYGAAQIPTDGLDLFLKGFTRRSTLRVARWVWDQLQGHPEGGTLNLAQAARELGMGRTTARRAVEVLVRWGRLLEASDYSTGRRPGRPKAYKIHHSFTEAVLDCTSAKRGLSPHTPLYRSTSTSCHTDAPASLTSPPYPRNPKPNRSLTLDKLLRADPNAILDRDRTVRLILARVREEVRTWPIGWDRRERILTGVAVAVRDQLRGPVRRGDAIALARGVVCELRRGERISGSLPIACRFARYAVRAALALIPRPPGDGAIGGEAVRVEPGHRLIPPLGELRVPPLHPLLPRELGRPGDKHGQVARLSARLPGSELGTTSQCGRLPSRCAHQCASSTERADDLRDRGSTSHLENDPVFGRVHTVTHRHPNRGEGRWEATENKPDGLRLLPSGQGRHSVTEQPHLRVRRVEAYARLTDLQPQSLWQGNVVPARLQSVTPKPPFSLTDAERLPTE